MLYAVIMQSISYLDFNLPYLILTTGIHNIVIFSGDLSIITSPSSTLTLSQEMDILMRRHLRKEEVPLITYTDLLVIATVSTSGKVPTRCIVYNKLWDTSSDSMQLNYEISAN